MNSEQYKFEANKIADAIVREHSNHPIIARNDLSAMQKAKLIIKDLKLPNELRNVGAKKLLPIEEEKLEKKKMYNLLSTFDIPKLEEINSGSFSLSDFDSSFSKNKIIGMAGNVLGIKMAEQRDKEIRIWKEKEEAIKKEMNKIANSSFVQNFISGLGAKKMGIEISVKANPDEILFCINGGDICVNDFITFDLLSKISEYFKTRNINFTSVDKKDHYYSEYTFSHTEQTVVISVKNYAIEGM